MLMELYVNGATFSAINLSPGKNSSFILRFFICAPGAALEKKIAENVSLLTYE
jgi:hypothetical protein